MKHDVEGVWYNQYGSRLHLKLERESLLRGSFQSKVGLAAGSEEVDVVGFASGSSISFVASFAYRRALTAWTGHVVQEGDERVLETQWYMAVELPHPERANELWRGTWSGADTWCRHDRQPPAHPRVPSHPLPEWP